MLVSGKLTAKLISCGMVFREFVPIELIPNMLPNWLMAIWIPTPVRNPTKAVRERKSPIKPNSNILAIIKKTAQKMATVDAMVT